MVLRVCIEIREEGAEEAEEEGDKRQRQQRIEIGPIQSEPGEQPRPRVV